MKCSICALLIPSMSTVALALSLGGVTGRVELATGQYVRSARVSVKDTNLVDYTDVFGVYRFADVPAGPVTLQVTDAGQEPAEAAVRVLRRADRSWDQGIILNAASENHPLAMTTSHQLTGLLRLGASLALASLLVSHAVAADSTASTQAATISGRIKNVATDQYLNKAQVSVKGTDIEALTDEFGSYRLVNLPPGPLTLQVFYTDLDVQEVRLDLGPGADLEQNFDLTSVARYGSNATVRLDPFKVAADRETNAQAIAINEQRFADNIKNVVSTDSLGTILGNNAGEFLKYLPGVTGEYAQLDINSIPLRGIGGGMTAFTSNGEPMASAFIAGQGRSFNPQTMTFQDISRVEVTKVPTPANAADSLAGSINLVSKGAFERARSELNYGINLIGNGENLTLRRTPYSVGDKKTYKTHLGGDFDFTWLVNKRLGIVFTGLHSDKYNEQHLTTITWNTGGTSTGASIARPYLQQFALTDGPQNKARTTVSMKVDFRVTPHSMLS